MSLRAKGLVLAMEDDTEIEGSSDELASSQAEVEGASDEIEGDVGEVTELNEAVSDADGDSQTLEKLNDIMEDSVESGEGLNETAAEIAEVAIEAICERLGIQKRIMPAMESFGSANSRVTATKIAMEGIQDTIRKIWEAIKAAAIRIWDKIKSFFIGVGKNVKALESHYQNLKDRVSKLDSGAKTKSADLDNAALARTFSANKKADLGTAELIIKNSISLVDHVEAIVQVVRTDADRIKSFVEGEPKVAEYKTFKSEMADKVSKAIVATQLSVLFSQPVVNGKGKVDHFGPLAGTRTIQMKYSERDVQAGDEKETIVSWGVSIGTYDKIEAKKIKALKPDEMRNLLAQGEKLVDALDAFEKKQKKLQDLNEAVKKVSDLGMSAIKKEAEESSAKARIVRSIASDMNEVNSAMSALAIAAPAAAFAAAKGVADYVSASIANLEVK